MKKYIGVFLLLCCILAGVLYFGTAKKNTPQVIQTAPENGGSHNPFLPVTFLFNRPIEASRLSFSIVPKTDVTIKNTAENTISVVPARWLTPLTQYTITVHTKPPFSLSFITQQEGSNVPGWNEQMDVLLKEYRTKRGAQDAALKYIRLNAPIQQPGFRIEYSYKNSTYTVELSPPHEGNKARFLSWLQQLGVTDFEIVRIAYINK